MSVQILKVGTRAAVARAIQSLELYTEEQGTLQRAKAHILAELAALPETVEGVAFNGVIVSLSFDRNEAGSHLQVTLTSMPLELGGTHP